MVAATKHAERVTIAECVAVQPFPLIIVSVAVYSPGALYLCVVVAVLNVSELPSPYCQINVLIVLLVSMLVLLKISVLSHCPVV